MIGVCESDLAFCMAFWLDLHTNAIVRTNDFKVTSLSIGTSPYQYFGLASRALPKRALPIPESFRPRVKEVIQLCGIGMQDSKWVTHERNTLRDLGRLSPRRAITIDEDQNMVIREQDGWDMGEDWRANVSSPE